MLDNNVKLTISFNDPALDADEQDQEAQRLIDELSQMDEIEFIYPTPDLNLPEGSKSIVGTLVGFLTAEISQEKVQKLWQFLSVRLSGKSIELDVEANGKKLKVKARNAEELRAAISAAKEFVEA